MKTILHGTLVLTAATLAACAPAEEAPADGAADEGGTAPNVVTIDSGTLRGEQLDGIVGFRGVPFARPPLGELRWKPPQPVTWAGELDATEFELPCPQPVPEEGANGGGVSGPTSEDCLYLNLWAPVDAEGAPVMLWLYGGAGYLGGAHLAGYHGTTFADRGVIVVTMNYRLGMLGNFAHPALSAAAGPDEPLANYALMDAIAGLEWIRRNIEAFGGDPNNVTLFGQSAGGAMVSKLLSSPPAEGLFHKAIIHSGTSLDDEYTLAEAEAEGVEMATALGLPGADATVEQLRAIPVDDILANPDVRTGTRGISDGRIKTVSTREGFATGQTFDVPVIAGSNSGEGGADRAHELVDLAASGAPSFQYWFTYVPEWRREEWDAPPHSAEIRYAFGTVGEEGTEHDRDMSLRVNTCWVAFAEAPVTARSIECGDGFTWQARRPDNDAIALLGETFEMARASDVLEDAEGT